jgi:glycosyltransferase involved in cell wall biosynthesis
MEIHQVVVSASPGDAVTNAALEIRGLLRRVGPSEIFARYLDPDLAGEVFPLSDYAARSSTGSGHDVLVYHASIGEPAVLSFLMERPERLVVLYHNITPPEYFAPHDPDFARLLADGRLELLALRDRTELALGVSPFNARELEAMGFPRVGVSPLVIDVDPLLSVEPDPSLSADLAERSDGPLVLFVGQLLPHKRPDLLLQAYYVLVSYLLPEAYLMVVGPARLEPYRQALQRLVSQLNLDRAYIPGQVTLAELAALYRGATLFVTLSEHEGVCVPLLEAMAFDVPVMARAYAAIPETLDGAGLLLPAEDDPLLLAEAMARLLEDKELRADLVAAGRQRLGDFDPEVARATFLEHLAGVV